jgi:hypothetical protein
MAIEDQNVNPTARSARKSLPVSITTAISLAGVVVYKFTPGYRFRLTGCSDFARTVAAVISYVVKVGGRIAVASVTPVAAAETVRSLSTTLANLRGSATEAITIELTTDGSGAATNLAVNLEIRPLGMSGDQGAVK